MKSVSYYHKSSGLLTGSLYTFSDDLAVALNTPDDHIAIDGHHDHLSKRVNIETGDVVDYQPPCPSEHHEWNDDTKRWVINADRQAKLDAHHGALQKINTLEATQNRFLREVHLGVNVAKATARLKAIEEEIVELRKSIMQELLPQGD